MKKEIEKSKVGAKENITMMKLAGDITKEELATIRKALKEGDDKTISLLKRTKRITHLEKLSNLIVDVGLNVLCRRLAGDTTYSGEINYGALGTGSTAISASDTQLENEVYRTLASDSAVDGRIAYVDFFYDKSDVSGTFTRFGNFIDGTASADSGILFSEKEVNWTKTLNDSLFIACKYTLTSL